MAAFAEFYGFTPAEFRALTLDDFNALADYRRRVLRAQAKASRKKGH